MERFIETYTGHRFYFDDPKPEQIFIEDIAHALGNLCRYTGHSRYFYSVGEHSVAVSEITGTLEGLLHDAGEAYLTDINSPLKQMLPDYREIEHRVNRAVAERFNLQYPFPKEIKQADLQQLSCEAKFLIPSGGDDWDDLWNSIGGRPNGGIIPRCLNPRNAERLFLKRFEFLGGRR